MHNGGGAEVTTMRQQRGQFDNHYQHTPPHFHSTVSLQKLRRFNTLIFVFRLATFSFSFASAVFMLTNSRGDSSPHWYDFDAFRYFSHFMFYLHKFSFLNENRRT